MKAVGFRGFRGLSKFIICYLDTLKDSCGSLVWARCAPYIRGLLITVFPSVGFMPRVKNTPLNDCKLFQLVLPGPAVPISEGLILDTYRICSKSTHKKENRKMWSKKSSYYHISNC